MPDIINISVENKIATKTDDTEYVCDNSVYVARFAFDAEWDAYDTKTARFSYNGSYIDIVFTGTECHIPIISDTYFFNIGVYAGNLHTTTPARVPCKKSILCDTGFPADPPDDVYNQIMAKLNSLGSADPEAIAKAVADYLAEHPIEETDPTVPEWAKAETKPTYTADEVGAISQDDLQTATDNALAQAKASGEFDGAKGDKGDPGAAGAPGEKGEKGDKGDAGAPGEKGEKGDPGAAGAPGEKGEKGEKGDKGDPGESGITPTIGANGNWFLGTTDTGKPARGEKGDKGDPGESGSASLDAPVLTSPILLRREGETDMAGIYLTTVATGYKTAEIELADANENCAVAIRNLRTPTGTSAALDSYAATKAYVDGKVAAVTSGQSAYAAAQTGGYTGAQADFYADLAAMQGLAAALAAM